MRNIVVFIVLLAAITYYFGDNVPEHSKPPGILVAASPIEQAVTLGPWKKGNYLITPFTTFNGRARVLEKYNPYMSSPSYSDQPAELKELSPYDLTVGWRELSDSTNVDNMLFNHGGKISDRRVLYFNWKYCKHPDYVKTLLSTSPSERQFDHLHIIPADNTVNQVLEKAVKGDVVELSGYISEAGTSGKKDIFSDQTYGEHSIPGETLWLTELKIEQ